MIGNFNDHYPCPNPPERPPHEWNPPPACPPSPPPLPPHDCGCNPPPSFPSFCPTGMPPHPPLMPPAPSVVEGESLYQAFNCLNDRVNICISTYNQVMQNGYKVLRDMHRAAEVNGAYYTKGEVWVEEGYSAEESATYTIIHKANLDKKGNPIRMELHLGYGNTTNSKVPQNIFSASQITFADKMVVAQPMGQQGWYGNVIYRGTPLPHADAPTLYTMGWTRSGVMKVYNNSVNPDQMLCDTVENAMGVSGVLIQNGEILKPEWYNQIPGYDKQMSRICIGQNMQTREVIIICCGTTNDINRKGMTSIACANILRQYGCDIAVEVMEGENTGATDKGRLLFDPPGNDVPQAYAFWYISRRCHYHNDFQTEIGKLTQIYGEQLWRTRLAENKVNGFDQRLKDEVAARELGDQELDTKITGEIERAKAAEQDLQNQIDAIDIDALDSKLEDEIKRATAAEATLDKKIDDTKTELESDIESAVAAEKERAETAEANLNAKIEADVTAERNRAQQAESALQANITQEIERATQAETTLNQKIENTVATEQQRAQDAEADLLSKITAETERATQAETTIDQKYTAEVQKINTLYQTLTNQVTTMDVAVTEMQKTINQIEITLNNMKDLISESQTLVREVKNLLDAIENGTADIPYVKISGDTMTGNLHMGMGGSGNSYMVLMQTSGDEVGLQALPPLENGAPRIKLTDTTHTSSQVGLTNLADPKNPSDAVNLKTLEESVTDLTSGDTPLPYVKKTGDKMTGVLTVESDVIIGKTAEPTPTSGYNLVLIGEGQQVNIRNIGGVIGLSKGAYGQMQGAPVIRNVGAPVQNADAANKKYVDDQDKATLADAKTYTDNSFSGLEALLDSYYPKTGGDLAGDINLLANSTGSTNSRIIGFNLGKTVNPNKAFLTVHANSANKPCFMLGYGNYDISTGKVDTPIEVKGVANPTTNASAMNKQYADEHYLSTTGGTVTGELYVNVDSVKGIKITSSTKNKNSPSLLFSALAPDATDTDTEFSLKTGYVLLRSIQESKANNPILHIYARRYNDGVIAATGERTIVSGVAAPTSANHAVPLDYLQTYVREHAGSSANLEANILNVSDYEFRDNMQTGSNYGLVLSQIPASLPEGTTANDWKILFARVYTSSVLDNHETIMDSPEGFFTNESSYIALSVFPANPLINPQYTITKVGTKYSYGEIHAELIIVKKGNLL